MQQHDSPIVQLELPLSFSVFPVCFRSVGRVHSTLFKLFNTTVSEMHALLRRVGTGTGTWRGGSVYKETKKKKKVTI